jgi:hypothetical protein
MLTDMPATCKCTYFPAARLHALSSVPPTLCRLAATTYLIIFSQSYLTVGFSKEFNQLLFKRFFKPSFLTFLPALPNYNFLCLSVFGNYSFFFESVALCRYMGGTKMKPLLHKHKYKLCFNKCISWPRHTSGGWSPDSHRGAPGSNPGLVLWYFVMGKSGAGAGFLRGELRVSPANLHSICFSTIIFTITRGRHNRGQEWPQCQ